MNVRLRFNVGFRAANWFGGELLVNNYDINIQLITQTLDPMDHNVCMGRIRTVFEMLENSVLINQTDVGKIDELTRCGMRVVALPQEPIDQIVGITLFEKLNSVLEERMRVTDLDLCSLQGDNIWFMHSEHERIDISTNLGWWDDAGPLCHNILQSPNGNNVVKLTKPLTWEAFNLDWDYDDEDETEVNVDHRPTVIIKLKDEK